MCINRKSDSDFKHVYAFLAQFFISVVSGLEKRKKWFLYVMLLNNYPNSIWIKLLTQ